MIDDLSSDGSRSRRIGKVIRCKCTAHLWTQRQKSVSVCLATIYALRV